MTGAAEDVHQDAVEHAIAETTEDTEQAVGFLGEVFDEEGPFREWMENIFRPWDALGGEVLLGRVIEAGNSGLDALNTVSSDIGNAAQANKTLAALMPGLELLDKVTATAGIIGGLYAMIAPPEYDHGAQRWVTRAAGAAAVVGDGIGLGVSFGAIATGATVAGLSIPVIGQVLGAAAGIYLAGDWIFHHTHQIEHGFNTAWHTVERCADEVGDEAAHLFRLDDKDDEGGAVTTNALDALIQSAERGGAVPLPALTQAELCALGAARTSMVCERTWNWWTGFSEEERDELTVRSLALLATRKLIVPARGSVPAVPVPQLGVVLAARSIPEPLVICHVPGPDHVPAPRFFGLAGETGGTRAVVCEVPMGREGHSDFGTMFSYSLMTAESAGKLMAAWAKRAGKLAAGRDPAAGHGDDAGRPVADVYSRGEDGKLERTRIDPLDGEFPGT